MEQLVHAWDVLATMTPPEYSAIRPVPGQFQRISRATSTAASSSRWEQERGHAQTAHTVPELLALVRPRTKPRLALRRRP